jgi:3-phenylpropionate/trans-cinnamate dioxygenase ferredoxin reductase subunit
VERIIVIGAGQAASSLMVKLRSSGFEGEICLIGEEPHLPYQRPPLSKKYLAGEMPRERLLLRQEAWYEKNRIDVRLGCRVLRIDRQAKRVELADGEAVAYDRLVLTTGARPRRLPAALGGDLLGVFMMRDLADADALARALRPGQRMLVIGGGYIGLEAAAEAAKKGLEVTLIEAAERLLQRVAAKETANFFRDLHRAHGVVVREGVGIERLAPRAGGGLVAGLADGTSLEVDLAVVGIGILPNSELAAEAGLDVVHGAVSVDAFGRASDPSISAAGDCASVLWNGRPIRLESVQNAQDQAVTVALDILGEAEPYRPEPWFWSDQYDVKLQIAGLNHGYDQVVRRLGAKDGAAAHFYYRGDTLLAVDAMNDPVAYNVAKRLLAAGRSLPKAAAADPAVDLKTFLAGA